MADTFNKKEREKKKAQKRKEKQFKKEAKREQEISGNLEDMMAYVDENGVLQDTPPDPKKKLDIKANSIEIGVPTREKVEIDPILEGTLKFFDEQKGYGFIKTSDDESIFVHQSAFSGEPKQGSKVKFEKEKGPKGWVAVRVSAI